MTERPGPGPDLLAELAALGSLVVTAGKARTSQEVAAAALEILARSTGADAGGVLYGQGAGLTLEATVGRSVNTSGVVGGGRGMSPKLMEALAATSEPLFVAVTDAPLPPAAIDLLTSNGLARLLIAPIRTAGHLAGALALGWDEGPEAPPNPVTIQLAATMIGASLENARLVEQLQRTLASDRRFAVEEAALESLTLITETAGAFHELAATTIGRIVSLVGASAGSYALVTDDDRIAHTASVRIDRAWLEGSREIPASEMVSVQRLLEGSGPYLQEYVEGSVLPRTLEMARERGWTTFAMIPIVVRDRLAALINLFFTSSPDLPDATRTLTAIARIASISLANFRLRERLIASETRYRVLFEESPDAMVLLSRDGQLIDANPAALVVYRTDREGLRAFLASGLADPDDDERRRRAEVLAGDGRGIVSGVGRRPDGSTFRRELGVVRVEIDGEPRVLLIVRDLTEQTNLQQELLQAQKMEAIGQLVSGVAHELNNPLAAIVAFSQLIRRDERLPDDMRHDAELLVQEADRTRRIVQNLLDFARQRRPERHPTSILALVESVLAFQSYSLAAGRIDLSLDVPADLPLIDVDRSQLQQVLLNLTLNAIQAIRSERPQGRIWISARSVPSRTLGRKLRLSVSDDGPGIPEAAWSRLFVPFYTTKPQGEGTGLGLSVSFGIVAAHGGTLRFEPRAGGGAMFTVELPASGHVPAEPRGAVAARLSADPADPLARPGARPSTEKTGGGAARPRVLVLDDEPSIRAFLTKSLRLAGLEPVAVSQGADALERCAAESFAAILVDHRMPGMSGTEVFDAVVAIRPELAPRFIFMSGDVRNDDLRAFASLHNVALLAKPFDVDTVNRLVADVVAGSVGPA
jgi:PAS domain S-box-containing protein